MTLLGLLLSLLGRKIWVASILVVIVFGNISCERAKSPIKDKVLSADGHRITLKEHGEVVLIGVYLPNADEPNYFPEYYTELQSNIVGQDVEVRIIKERLEPEPDAKKHVLVELFLEGENINKQLLTEGKAFFSEDYWNKNERKEYRNLEMSAREKRLGVWRDMNILKVLAIRHKDQRWAYHPESSQVKKMKEKDKIYYYTDIPYYYHGIGEALLDDESRSKWESASSN